MKLEKEVKISEIPEMLPKSNRHDQLLSTVDSGLSGSHKYHSDATIRTLLTTIARFLYGTGMSLPRV